MQSPSIKSPKRLFRTIAFAAALGIVFTASIAYANDVYLLHDHGNGTTTWLSCGSSAGNTIWTCTSSGCVAHYNDPGGFNQSLADKQCASREMEVSY